MTAASSELSDLTAQVRVGWEVLAAGPARVPGLARAPLAPGPAASPDRALAARFSRALVVTASPGSLLCPPGWAGIVVIGARALATAPDAELAARMERALAGVPAAALTDEGVLRARLPVLEVLGPAALAYLSPGDFHSRASIRPADHDPGEMPGYDVAELGARDAAFGRFLDEADPSDRHESGLAEITSPAFAIRQGGQVVSAAGYRAWPNRFAHLCVLTAADARGRGLARLAGSAAAAHALAAGFLPQWRARLEASRAVARSLGFTDLGAQVSLRVRPDSGDTSSSRHDVSTAAAPPSALPRRLRTAAQD